MKPFFPLLARYTERLSGPDRTRVNRRRLRLEPLEDRTVPTAVAAPPGLVSWWTADNTAADLMTRNDGTLLSGATFAPGKVGQAFSFDGFDDSVQMWDSDSFKLTQSLTIEGWVLIQSFGTGRREILFRGDYRAGKDPYQLASYSGNKLIFSIDSVDTRVDLEVGGIPLGEFIHVAATLDDSEGMMRVYVNGVLAGEQFTSVRPFADLDPAANPGVGIGNHSGNPPDNPTTWMFHGLIDELSLYNRALSPDEVAGLYNAGSDGKIRMVVAKTAPDLGRTVTTPPTSFTVDFSYPVDPASVQPGDFLVNGVAATSVSLTNADTATFTFATSPVTAEGVQAMHMDAGAVTRSGDGLALAAYDGIFTYDHTTKFYVVNDASGDRTYRYVAPGNALGDSALASGNTAPRGAASDAAGTTVWVVDANKKVYVYDASGGLLGSWTAGGLHSQAQVEGIATTGTGGYITDVWLVDARQDRVYRYANAAGLLWGSQNAASSFRLASGNSNPKGIVTDGTYLWVVNDGSTDRVFRYTLSGSLQGSWVIDPANASPTGITLDPTTSPSHLWIVDSGTDRVYQYDLATSKTSGSLLASTSFALAAGNSNPQGIADPPAPQLPLTSAPAATVRILPASAPLPAMPFRGPSIDVAAPSSAIQDVLPGARWGWELLRGISPPTITPLGSVVLAARPGAGTPPEAWDGHDVLDPLAVPGLAGELRPGSETSAARLPDGEPEATEASDALFALLADRPLVDDWSATGR